MGKSAMSLSRGRYTLAEAVEVFLAHQADFDREALAEDLRFLMERKRIIAYQPGLPKSINSISTNNSGEFYWEDLNKIWLSHFDNQKWHFSKPVERLVPDWAYWRLMKHVELEAAIYLSLNVNPHWSVFTENLDGDVLAQYRDRLAQVVSWIVDAKWVVGKVKSSWFIEHTKISLEPFAQWFCDKMGELKRPLEFDVLAGSSGVVGEYEVPAKLNGITPVDGTLRSELSWELKSLGDIQRMPGYRAVLYQTLKKMHEEGQQNAPTAYEILESWRNEFKHEQPKEYEIWVSRTTFQFKNKEGKKKTVDSKALNDAIQRLITTH